MSKKAVYILVAVVLVLTFVLTACAKNSDAAVIKVATDAVFPPFEMTDEATKEIIGFDIDLMKAVAEKAGLEIEFVDVAWDPLLAGMASCQYDMAISAMTITEERAKQFNFSDPYVNAGQIVVVKTTNTEITSKDDLSGKVVGAQLGTTGAMEVEKIDGATLKSYDSYELAFMDLINGQIDAVIGDYPLAVKFVLQNSDSLMTVGDVFTEEYYGIAICKTKTDLVEKINAALAEVLASGLIAELEAKWYPVTD